MARWGDEEDEDSYHHPADLNKDGVVSLEEVQVWFEEGEEEVVEVDENGEETVVVEGKDGEGLYAETQQNVVMKFQRLAVGPSRGLFESGYLVELRGLPKQAAGTSPTLK